MIYGKKSKYQKTIFWYFLIMAIIPLLTLGIYSYHIARDAVRKNSQQANQTLLLQIENQMDKSLDTVQQNFVRLAASNYTQSMIDMKYEEASYSRLINFVENITIEQAYVEYVSSYTFINFKHGWVLSNKGMYPLNQVENKELLTLIKESQQNYLWLNQTGKDFTNSQEINQTYINNGYVTFIARIPVYSNYPEGAFVIEIDKARFEAMMSSKMGNGYLLVFDSDKELVYSENQELAEYYQNHKEELEKSQSATIQIGSQSFDILIEVSEGTRWIFVGGYDARAVSGELNQILKTMAIIILILVMIVGVISVLGTQRVYQPVGDLVKSISKTIMAGSGDGPEDEFSMINKGLHALIGHNEELQQLIERQKDQLIELFAVRLIRGRVNETEILQTKERLGLPDCPCMIMVSIMLRQRTGQILKEQMEQDVINLEVLENLPDEIKSLLIYPPFIYAQTVLLVMGGNDNSVLECKVQKLESRLDGMAAEISDGLIDIGVSQPFTNESHFRKAYQESQEALKSIRYLSNTSTLTEDIQVTSSITYYSDLIQRSNEEKSYNVLTDTEIKDAVDECDFGRAVQAVDAFLREIAGYGTILSEQKYNLYRFLLAILSVGVEAGMPVNQIFPQGEDDLFLRFEQMGDFEAIRKFFIEQVLRPVIQSLGAFRKSGAEMVLENVMKLIEERDGDLALTECAETLGYHPSYIWRVMKSTTDKTFSDYIADWKLKKAEELLINTDLAVNEIAEKLNYSNSQNFIRLFKKHKNITPGKFRSMNRSQ